MPPYSLFAVILFVPTPLLLVPFALLLLLIAVMPLTPAPLKHAWEKYYPLVSLGLAALVAGWYSSFIPGGGKEVLHTFHEYISFIVLIGSLYITAGGIHIAVRGEATPRENVFFLLAGAVFANLIGTTGASMVLIRPWIRMNKIRVSAFHVVFFIFIVSNIGGALTPIGDPPLFLGYLLGVPFFWLIQHVWWQWLLTMALVLAAFYLFDRRSFRHASSKVQHDIQETSDQWQVDGTLNLGLLALIVVAVFLPSIPWLREGVMALAAWLSIKFTHRRIWEQNRFSFGPIKEVAILFVGIFGTMLPVLAYLSEHASALGFVYPWQYYFSSGIFSSVLDNAPTYLNFFELAHSTSRSLTPELYANIPSGASESAKIFLANRPSFVAAVSLGSVFFGAMTYIGNGPNFMVKAIAHDSGVHCPNFVQYIIRYSLPVLLPILVVIGLIAFLH